MTFTDALRAVGLIAWLFCLACLLPAIGRILRRRARYFDPVWGVVFMLALNRLSFISRVSIEGSYATAIVLAIAMGCLSLSFQRYDR